MCPSGHLQDEPEVKALAKTLMVLSEDRFRSATAVGASASPRPSDWQISFDEQVTARRLLQILLPKE